MTDIKTSRDAFDPGSDVLDKGDSKKQKKVLLSTIYIRSQSRLQTNRQEHPHMEQASTPPRSKSWGSQ
jgi:hypothetical protein